VGEMAFEEPFFQQTVDRFCADHPAVRVVRTGLEELLAVEAARGGREPAGFIFHMGRCGSTLVANLLRALRGSRVIVEAPARNQILGTAASTPTMADRAGLLRAAVHALGGRPGGPYFVKFSSWNALYLPLVRAAF